MKEICILLVKLYIICSRMQRVNLHVRPSIIQVGCPTCCYQVCALDHERGVLQTWITIQSPVVIMEYRKMSPCFLPCSPPAATVTTSSSVERPPSSLGFLTESGSSLEPCFLTWGATSRPMAIVALPRALTARTRFYQHFFVLNSWNTKIYICLFYHFSILTSIR